MDEYPTLDEFLVAVADGVVAAECATGAWNGSASRFDDAQYARSCVLDRADCSADWKDKPAKQRYSLPIREPGGAINKNAVAAAKGRLGQTSACSAAKAKASSRLDGAASACGVGKAELVAVAEAQFGSFDDVEAVEDRTLYATSTAPLYAHTGTTTTTGTLEATDDRPIWSSQVVGQFAAVAGRPWCLKPEAMDVLVSAANRGIVAGEVVELEPVAPKPTKRAGVGIIPLSGLITPTGGGPLGQLLGMGGGLADFRQALVEAVADDTVKAIVLDVNSPGGLVDHVPETAAMVRKARERKPITAVASTQAASAAYWIASQANEIVVTPSGEVGSIGAYMLHMDKSKHLEKEGLSVTLTSAGKYKTEANQYEPLSKSAQEAQQRKVDRFYSKFVGDVAAGRGVGSEQVINGYGEGRTLLAEDALEQGLVDRVGTVDQVVLDTIDHVTMEAQRQRVTTMDAARRRVSVLMD